MTKQALIQQGQMGYMAWVLPNPVWQALVLDSRPVVHVYTLCNHSQAKITISDVRFVQNDDTRVNIIGGSCRRGLVLMPNETGTVEVEGNPRALGTVKQVLSVHHSGAHSPLWIAIVFAVIRRERA